MDLWIRSQDKKYLIPNPMLGYHEKDGQHSILAYIRDEYRVMATYKTEKRVLEILDEIQDLLETIEDVNQMVYQMPKE